MSSDCNARGGSTASISWLPVMSVAWLLSRCSLCVVHAAPPALLLTVQGVAGASSWWLPALLFSAPLPKTDALNGLASRQVLSPDTAAGTDASSI